MQQISKRTKSENAILVDIAMISTNARDYVCNLGARWGSKITAAISNVRDKPRHKSMISENDKSRQIVTSMTHPSSPKFTRVPSGIVIVRGFAASRITLAMKVGTKTGAGNARAWFFSTSLG